MLLNTLQAAKLWKIAVYGKPGRGKTHLTATAPKPVSLLLERHGFETLRYAASQLGIPVPPAFWIRSLDDLRLAQEVLASNHADPLVELTRTLAGKDATRAEIDRAIKSLPYVKPETVALDSVTEVSYLQFQDTKGTAKLEKGKDGLPKIPIGLWSVLQDRFARFVRAFRDLDYHVIMVALEDDHETGEGEARVRQVQPALSQRKLADVLSSTLNALGRIETVSRRVGEGEDGIVIDRQVRFLAPSWMLTKTAGGLSMLEPADFGTWVRKLNGEESSAPNDDENGNEQTEIDNA